MKRTYTYQVLEGSARTVGRLAARNILTAHPEAAAFFAKPFMGNADRLKEGNRLLELNERWCPGLNEEIAGYAEEFGVEPEAVVYYTATIPKTGHCSHFAVLPDRTTTGTTLCGRSYEWSLEDELTLSTIHIPGRAAHTGFGVFTFGRFDGVNEHGLWVSMSAANPAVPLPETEGFRFWSLLRTILDRASTVEEALEIARPFPLAFHVNLIVADKGGHAALIEKGPAIMDIKTIDRGYIYSTNHYALPATSAATEKRFEHSLKRAAFLEEALSAGKQSPESIKRMLSSSFPRGLACHYYEEWFGTLWSIQADLSKGSIEVCFGPADVAENGYRTFSPRDPAGISRFEAELPQEKAAEGTWATAPNL
jgi:hypothetical protein